MNASLLRRNHAEDMTRRELLLARRSPNWQRLIDTVHKAQELRGYESRHFAPDVVESFGESFIGYPAEVLKSASREFAAYWVVRQVSSYSPALRSGESGHSFVQYKLKAVYGDDLACVHTIAEETFVCEFDAEDDSAPGTYLATPSLAQREELRAWEERTARDFVARKNHQIG